MGANDTATLASVIAASGMAMQSIVPPSRPRPLRASMKSLPMRMSAPRPESTPANATSPWIESRPTPVTRTGPPPMAPAARKYDADDASPSTCSVPGER